MFMARLRDVRVQPASARSPARTEAQGQAKKRGACPYGRARQTLTDGLQSGSGSGRKGWQLPS